MWYLILKAGISAGVIVGVSEIARRNNFAASWLHSLPLVSLLAFVWIYLETRDTALIARHAQGTFWFVIPTLPMFIAMPWLLRHGWSFWPSLLAGIVLTALLYLLTMRLLTAFGVRL